MNIKGSGEFQFDLIGSNYNRTIGIQISFKIRTQPGGDEIEPLFVSAAPPES